MSQLFIDLLQLWVLWYSSAAAFGSYFGTLAAIGTFYGIRALHRKLKGRKYGKN